MIDQDGSVVAVSVVMPAYNEGATLAAAVRRVVAAMEHRGEDFEVLVVENGSTDNSCALAEELAAELPCVRAMHNDQADYGKALRAGFLAARGDVVVNFDVDYIDLEFLEQAATQVRRPGGPSVVVGTKLAKNSDDTRALPRRLVTLVFSSLLRYGFGLHVSDTHGMKAMNRSQLLPVVKRCRLGTDLFDTEMVLRAEREGLGSAEIPVRVVETRPARSSIARRIPRTLVGLVKLRLVLWQR